MQACDKCLRSEHFCSEEYLPGTLGEDDFSWPQMKHLPNTREKRIEVCINRERTDQVAAIFDVCSPPWKTHEARLAAAVTRYTCVFP